MSLDDEIRALERAVMAGDETARQRLESLADRVSLTGTDREALWGRTGAATALEARLREHTGPDWTCDACDGRGRSPASTIPCPACDGDRKRGQLRFVRQLLATDYATLCKYGGRVSFDYTMRVRTGSGRPATERVQHFSHIVEAVSLNADAYGQPVGVVYQEKPGTRGLILVASAKTLVIASAAQDDWVGHSLLLRWRSRLPRAHGNYWNAVPGQIAKLKKLGATEEPGPLVAWWARTRTPVLCDRPRLADRPIEDPEAVRTALADATTFDELARAVALERAEHITDRETAR